VRREEKGAWANRGLVIRAWNARLGGREARPWVVERGVGARGSPSSTIDLVPPPGLTQLEPGDHLDAVIEHLILPQNAADYLGPNEPLRAALREHGNTWRVVAREATGNDVRVKVASGTLTSRFPAITVRAADGHADLTLTGGLGFIPLTFTGLSSPTPPALLVNEQPFTQARHGNDFWQTDYDAASGTWSHTYNLPAGEGERRVRF